MFDFGLYTQVSDSGPHGPLVSFALLFLGMIALLKYIVLSVCHTLPTSICTVSTIKTLLIEESSSSVNCFLCRETCNSSLSMDQVDPSSVNQGHIKHCIPRAHQTQYTQGTSIIIYPGHIKYCIPRAHQTLHSQGTLNIVYPRHIKHCKRGPKAH